MKLQRNSESNFLKLVHVRLFPWIVQNWMVAHILWNSRWNVIDCRESDLEIKKKKKKKKQVFFLYCWTIWVQKLLWLIRGLCARLRIGQLKKSSQEFKHTACVWVPVFLLSFTICPFYFWHNSSVLLYGQL